MRLNGIKTGPYNVPDWEQSPAGLRRCLDSLFATTPPTAIIFDRPNEMIGAQLYLARKKIYAPEDISLISDDDPTFEWCEPPVCCFQWQIQQWVSRTVRWVVNIANNKDDKQHRFTKARFIERGSIGPVPTTRVAVSNS
jgi:DNA-binding LacI/PurR family transcriptional regulator